MRAVTIKHALSFPDPCGDWDVGTSIGRYARQALGPKTVALLPGLVDLDGLRDLCRPMRLAFEKQRRKRGQIKAAPKRSHS